MEEACSLQPMNESCQKSIWDNIFIANLDHLSNSTVFRGKVHSQVACHKGSLAHDFLASRFPWNKAKSHGCSMSCARWNCLSLLSTQHKGFSLGPSHLIITCYVPMFQCLMRATSQLLYLLWFRPVMLVFTQDEISLSKYCMMLSLQPSNAQQLSPLSEIMILPVALQYSTRALIIHSMFLKRHFSKWRSESQNGRQTSCSLDV